MSLARSKPVRISQGLAAGGGNTANDAVSCPPLSPPRELPHPFNQLNPPSKENIPIREAHRMLRDEEARRRGDFGGGRAEQPPAASAKPDTAGANDEASLDSNDGAGAGFLITRGGGGATPNGPPSLDPPGGPGGGAQQQPGGVLLLDNMSSPAFSPLSTPGGSSKTIAC